MSTMEEVTARMHARLASVPLRQIADMLVMLDAKRALDEAERLTRAVVIDEICERCPEADAAFDAWAESDDMDSKNASAAIVKAVRALR